MTKDLYWGVAPPEAQRVRRLSAWLLGTASVALGRMADRLQVAAPAVAVAGAEPVLEFYAEAGAPEGALYVDGRLVGHLVGVQRL